MRRVRKIIKFLVCLEIGLFVFMNTVNAETNPYNKMQTIEGVTTVSCTWFAWQQAYEKIGIELPRWGNAVNWYERASKAGYAVGSVAKANSIAVWQSSVNSYGHVAYVVSVSGNTMTINEGGITILKRNEETNEITKIPFNGDGIYYNNVVPSTLNRNETTRLLGFIYLTNEKLVGQNSIEEKEVVEKLLEEDFSIQINIPITPSPSINEVNPKIEKKESSKNDNIVKEMEKVQERKEVSEEQDDKENEISLEELKKEEKQSTLEKEIDKFSLTRNIMNILFLVLFAFIKRG